MNTVTRCGVGTDWNRLLILMLLLAVIAGAGPAEASRFDHIKTSIVNYGQPYLAEPLKSQVTQWQGERYDVFIGGDSPLAANPEALWADYFDHCSVYLWKMNPLRDFAEEHGYVFEDILLHMTVDHEVANGWKWLDKFGIDEVVSGGYTVEPSNRNGVLLETGSGFSDVTNTVYHATAAVELAGNLYVGYPEPFDQVNVVLSRASQNLMAAWQYWNGAAWVSLTVTDGTARLTRDGRISFIPPAGWKQTSVNGSRVKWWLRLAYTAATVTPVIASLTGDDWTNGSPNLSRGWDAAAAGIVNTGLGPLEYNPAPPSGASARFRYQARAGGYRMADRFFINPAKVQNGGHPWAQYVIETIGSEAATAGFTGTYLDNMGGYPSAGIVSPVAPELYTDAGISTSPEWLTLVKGQYAEIAAGVHESIPAHRVGGNGLLTDLDLVFQGDFSVVEYVADVRMTAGAAYENNFDYFHPDVNPNGHTAVMMVKDVQDYLSPYGGGYVAWDRAQRGPLAALTYHYIGMNEYTNFLYYCLGGWMYSETDEVYYYNPATSRLSQPLDLAATTSEKQIYGDFAAFPAGSYAVRVGDEPLFVTKVDNATLKTTYPVLTSHAAGETVWYVTKGRQSSGEVYTVQQVYRWGNWFPAIGVDIGMPDPSGLKGGARDVDWNGMWRRDFTNAIVIHNPAAWNSSVEELTEFSTPASLGGTYYPLRADGSTGAAVTTIALRSAEGAILMTLPRSLDSDAGLPVVSIVSPVNNEVVAGTVTVTVAARGGLAPVARVELFCNGMLAGSSTTAPYTFTLNLAAVTGNVFSVLAKAYDTAGSVGASQTVTLQKDITAPVVSLTSPAQGAVVAGFLTVTAAAQDATGITTADLYVNGVRYGSDTAAPYTFTVNTVNYANGSLSLLVKAYDANNNTGISGTVTVTIANDKTPPTVAITSPTTGAILYGPSTVTVSASDAIGVAKVELYVNGVLSAADVASPYSFTFNSGATLVAATYTLTAVASDAAGNRATSKALLVTVKKDTTVPTLTVATVTSPLKTTTAALSGTVLDNVAIASVTVQVNGGAGQTATVKSSSWTVTATGLVAGSNTLLVAATDTSGNKTTKSVTIVVDMAGPVLTIAAVTTPTTSSTQTIKGTVSDSSGVASVTVKVGSAAPVSATILAGNWSRLVSLVRGTNTITVTATDKLGNSTVKTTTIVRK